MWIKRCYFRGCNNNSLNANKGLLKGVSFIGLPDPRTDLNRWIRWFQACALTADDIAAVDVKEICICSLHFVGPNGPTSEHPDPVMYEMRSTVEKKQSKFLPSKSQKRFTFVSVKQEKMGSCVYNSSRSLTYDENIKIKEEILSRSGSDTDSVHSPDTLSAPSPPMFWDSESGDEMESFGRHLSPAEFVKTTFVNECNLPDNPENDPLSLTSDDFVNKNGIVANSSECASNSNVCAITYDFAVKEEPEDKFVACSDLFGQATTHLTGPSCGSAFRGISDFSEFSIDNIKHEILDDESNAIESENPDNANYSPTKKILRSGDSVKRPGHHLLCDPDSRSLESKSTYYCNTDNQNSKFMGESGGDQNSTMASTLRDALCSSSSCKVIDNERNNLENDALCSSSSCEGVDCDDGDSGDATLRQTKKNMLKHLHCIQSVKNQTQTDDNDLLHLTPSISEVSCFRRLLPKPEESSVKCVEMMPADNKCDVSLLNSTSKFNVYISAENARCVKNNVTLAGTSSESERMLPGSEIRKADCVQKKIKIPMKILPVPFFTEKTSQSTQASAQGTSENVSSENAQTLSQVVQRKVIRISSKKKQTPARTVPKLSKIVKKLEPSPHESAQVPAKSKQDVCCVQDRVHITSNISQASVEALQNLPHSVAKESQSNVQGKYYTKPRLICTVGNKMKTWPKLVRLATDENTLILSQGATNNIESSITNESAHNVSLSNSTEESTVPADRKNNIVHCKQLSSKFVHIKSESSKNHIVSKVFENEIVRSLCESDNKLSTEIVQENVSPVVQSGCADKVVSQASTSTTSCVIPKQRAEGLSQGIEYANRNWSSLYTQPSHYSVVSVPPTVSNLISHRNRYISTVETLNKRVRFLSRLKSILGNKNFHPYKSK
ncbi:uncharacterized protein LOC134530653 isoform X2 [Bacillus rossius redtenbacheri]|uniref:uncharacterized protein LOC134530653 isoform X2 n=1 Tax=Bacillus rossius redtenbacheri TaxID=93214 RepID=UPI002FDDE97F